MDNTELLDCTQALPCDLDDDEEEGETKHLVAWLEVSGNRHEVFNGRNIIGRDPDGCRIVIPSKVLSKQHAVVEVRSGTHTLADMGSSNKTRLGKLVLRPHVQYALQGGEKIRFGNVMTTYMITPEVCDDSGSETGSESMLPMMEDEEERSPSPVLCSKLDHSDTQRAVQNGMDGVSVPLTSVSYQNSRTPQTKGMAPSNSLDTPIAHLTDSLLQPSDAESSVVSATQSPAGKTTPVSPPSTHRPVLEEYNSDASTDVEDYATTQPCPNLLKPQIPPHPSPTTSIPETPPHSSHNITRAGTPVCTSPNTSIPETPAGIFPSISQTYTPACSLPNISIPETQAHSLPNRSLPVHPSPIATLDTPTKTYKDDHSGQSPDSGSLVFKKPLAASTLRASRSPNTPARVASLQKPSPASKACEAVSTCLFSADNPNAVDFDAPTQVFTNDESVDLDAPTQVFANDTSVDLDAQTQVFANDASVDLDAPTQLFANDASVDLDAPTQVFTRDVPGGMDPDAPTQIFTHDVPGDIDPDAPTQVYTNDAPGDIYPDAPTQVFTNVAPGGIDPDAPTQVFTHDTPVDIDPDAPTQVFTNDAPGSIDGIEDKLDATVHPVASSNTPEVCADDAHTQELTSGDVRRTGSQGSTQLSLPDESVNSPTHLCDPIDADVPIQPFFDTCTIISGPSSSIMEAWGHLDSNASLGTNTTPVGHTGNEDLQDSDAASDASKSLFNEEDEVDSIHGEGETDVFDSMKKSGKHLKEEDYHSDVSTDLEEDTLIDVSQTSCEVAGKTVPSLQGKDPAVECYDNERRVTNEVPHNQALKENCKVGRQSPATTSSSRREESPLPLTEQSIHSSTKTRRQHRQVTERLPLMPSESYTRDSPQETVPINISLSECYFDLSEESSEEGHLTATCKTGVGQLDWLSDSESEENVKIPSQKLFDLPSDTEGDEVKSRRKSVRPGSSQGSTQQSIRKRAKAAHSASPTSSPSASSASTPKHNHTKTFVPPSLTPISNPIPAPAYTTTTPTSTSTTTSTPTLTSVPACPPVPSLAIALTTRRQTRRGKTEDDTSISATVPVLPISTRNRSKRNTPGNKVRPASTTTNTSISPTTAASPTTVTTTSTTVITATKFTPSQDVQAKRRTRSQRITVQSSVNNRDLETEVLSESRASPQPSTSAATDINNSSANTRSRRGRRTTIPPMIKVKVEVTEDEYVQMTTLTTIKQEKEENETFVCEQTHIKTEPMDDLSQDNLHEVSGRSKRTRQRPERFSPERDIRLPGRKLRSKVSLPSSKSSGRVSPRNVPAQQRRSQRVLASMQSRRQEGAASVSNSEVTTLTMKVKEELKDSDEESLESVPLCTTLTLEADQPPKKIQQSRASTSRGARQAPPRATKKIKMEVVPKEESDEGNLEDSQNRITQQRAKQRRTSDYKKEEPTNRSSQNSFTKQNAKRRNSEAPVSATSSTCNFSSRATRSNKDVELWSPSKRQRQASTKPRVLFTGYLDPTDHKIVTDLGGRVVEAPNDCTVLVTTGIKRTCKLLSAIGMGCPIVIPDWLTMSKAAGNFVDPWQFLLKDHEAEEKYGFCLEDTIKSASNFLLFEGLSMYATPSVQPPPCQMRDIIECAGGDYLHAPPKKYEPQIRIISCSEDKWLWPSFRSLGIPILGVEFILMGLLRHELLLDEFVLG